MRLHITSPHHHGPLDATLDEFIRRRFDALPRHFDRDSCEVHLAIEHPTGQTKHRFVRANARINVPGKLLVARKRGRDEFAAVDAAFKALERAMDEWHHKQHLDGRHGDKDELARALEAVAAVDAVAALDAAQEASPDAVGGAGTAAAHVDGDALEHAAPHLELLPETLPENLPESIDEDEEPIGEDTEVLYVTLEESHT